MKSIPQPRRSFFCNTLLLLIITTYYPCARACVYEKCFSPIK
jgi:hypothetical protein